MLRIALLATLLVSIHFLFAKERILLHRIDPYQSTLFIANADGSAERPLLPNFGFDSNAVVLRATAEPTRPVGCPNHYGLNARDF